MSYLQKLFTSLITYFWHYLFFFSLTTSLLGTFEIISMSELEKIYHDLIAIIALAVIDLGKDLKAKQ